MHFARGILGMMLLALASVSLSSAQAPVPVPDEVRQLFEMPEMPLADFLAGPQRRRDCCRLRLETLERDGI